MTKLTDIQTILLSSASQRADGSLLPPPDVLGAATDRIYKAIAGLIRRIYVNEVAVVATEYAWRVDGGQHYGAVITDDGRAAINLEPEYLASPASSDKSEVSLATSSVDEARPTKAGLVLTLLKREQGATLAEIIDATSWLPHTTRAALTGLRKKGHDIARGKRGDETCYMLAA
jgi:hypothetical protein